MFDNFCLEMVEILELQDGQVLVCNYFLLFDLYMCGCMNDSKLYVQLQLLDEVMIGGIVGVVEVFKNFLFVVGDNVVGMFGW